MAKCPLYTATGDRGETSLVGGQRVSKCCRRLEAYGTVDEFSSFLGVALSHRDCPAQLKEQLLAVQNTLFDVGCYLATAPSDLSASADGEGINGLTQSQIEQVEGWTDALYAEVPVIRAFVLPGGSEVAAALHVARTVCRRAERRILELAAEEPVAEVVLRYMNRLSDYLFVASRYANTVAGIQELVWQAAR